MTNELTVRAPMMPLADIEKLAIAVAKSGLFGIDTPEKALALMSIAQAEGRHPALAARDYHIIKNTPAKKAEAMLRDFLQSGGKVEWHELTDDAADATFSHPAGGTARIKWDHARVKKAEIKSPMWTKYPRQMLRSRVVSEGVRTVCPMATSGMYVPEEVAEFDSHDRIAAPAKPQEPISVTAELDAFVGEAVDVETGEIIEPLAKRAMAAAMSGRNDFLRFYHDLSADDKEAVKARPEEWLTIADEADAARGVDPFGLSPLPPNRGEAA